MMIEFENYWRCESVATGSPDPAEPTLFFV
jgi:hypothetical protein